MGGVERLKSGFEERRRGREKGKKWKDQDEITGTRGTGRITSIEPCVIKRPGVFRVIGNFTCTEYRPSRDLYQQTSSELILSSILLLNINYIFYSHFLGLLYSPSLRPPHHVVWPLDSNSLLGLPHDTKHLDQ